MIMLRQAVGLHKTKDLLRFTIGVNPPRFVISVNNSEHFHFSYVRYIENKIVSSLDSKEHR